MREHIATISKRGQVTIPAEVQRLLDLRPGDKVRFVVQNDHVELAPAEFTAESVYGSARLLPGVEVDDDFKRQIAEAKEERVERMMRELIDEE